MSSKIQCRSTFFSAFKICAIAAVCSVQGMALSKRGKALSADKAAGPFATPSLPSSKGASGRRTSRSNSTQAQKSSQPGALSPADLEELISNLRSAGVTVSEKDLQKLIQSKEGKTKTERASVSQTKRSQRPGLERSRSSKFFHGENGEKALKNAANERALARTKSRKGLSALKNGLVELKDGLVDWKDAAFSSARTYLNSAYYTVRGRTKTGMAVRAVCAAGATACAVCGTENTFLGIATVGKAVLDTVGPPMLEHVAKPAFNAVAEGKLSCALGAGATVAYYEVPKTKFAKTVVAGGKQVAGAVQDAFEIGKNVVAGGQKVGQKVVAGGKKVVAGGQKVVAGGQKAVSLLKRATGYEENGTYTVKPTRS